MHSVAGFIHVLKIFQTPNTSIITNIIHILQYVRDTNYNDGMLP